MTTVQRIGKAATADLLRIFGALGRSGCCGDFPPSLVSRILFAANDSIFLILPVAVLHPCEEDDLDRIIAPAASGDFERTPLSGIFQSNLGTDEQQNYSECSNRDAFEQGLGVKVANEFDLYAKA
ncbi:hypothetical protein EOA33_33225, partial [Mesorhizobium sp. M4A.F.Ca.ET.050.02.1.1]